MIFEYFVFSTVYMHNLFSGVHPYETQALSSSVSLSGGHG